MKQASKNLPFNSMHECITNTVNHGFPDTQNEIFDIQVIKIKIRMPSILDHPVISD